MIHDILDSISDGLDSLLQLIVGGKHNYRGRTGNARRILKRKHKKGNGLKIGDKYIALDQTLKGGMLLLGKTGAGKSSRIFLNNLLSYSELSSISFICLDLAKELRDVAGGSLQEHLDGEDIVNFSDANASTTTWNPLQDLKPQDIHRFASDLVASTTTQNANTDPIWANLSTSLISYIIQLLKGLEVVLGTNKFTNLYNVRYLVVQLQGEFEKMNMLIAKYADDFLYSNLKAILANDKKMLNSIFSSTLSVLNLWQDEHIIRMTSSTTLDMESYRSQKKILWIQSSITQQKRLMGLNSLFLKAWFTHIMDAGIPKKEDNTIGFLADEMSAVRTMDKGYIPFISSQIRKFKSFGVFGFQSYSQCIELYGKEGATTLKANTGTVLYLGQQDLETATHISKSLGRYSYEKDGKTLSREVLTPEEVMHSHTKEGGFLLCNNERPIQLKRIKPYYVDRKMKKQAEIPTPEVFANNPMPELLPIDALIGAVETEDSVVSKAVQ